MSNKNKVKKSWNLPTLRVLYIQKRYPRMAKTFSSYIPLSTT